MSQQSFLSDASENRRQQARGPSDLGSIAEDQGAKQPFGSDDPLKKLKNALWTQVLRVEYGNIARIRVVSEHDDVFQALTNVDIMAEDEHEGAELLFDAADFEAPPDGAALSDLQLPPENI